MEQRRSSCLEEPLFQKRTYSWGRCTTEFRSNALQNVSCLEFLVGLFVCLLEHFLFELFDLGLRYFRCLALPHALRGHTSREYVAPLLCVL